MKKKSIVEQSQIKPTAVKHSFKQTEGNPVGKFVTRFYNYNPNDSSTNADDNDRETLPGRSSASPVEYLPMENTNVV